MKNLKKVASWFTIVELIVVITILAILWTIWFISYVWYISTSRDATRLSQIQIINQALEWYTKWKLPLPDDKVTIYANWVVIWYQWYAWLSVLSDIWVNEWWKDPLDDTYYSYFVDYKQKFPQLLTFLESERETQVSYKWFVTQANAADYTERYPRPFWAKLWIMIQSWSNAPIQDDSNLITNWLDVATTTSLYTAYFTQDSYISWSWKVLQKIQQSIWYDWVWLWAPRTCPDWFIRVPGNIEFNQSGFCVAKYEMTYEDAVTPNSSGTDYNTVSYVPWKTVVSKSWLYPIADISQTNAIAACKSMWEWFHLITNDEWMTLTRDLESNWSNWSWNSVWSGWIFRWISWETSTFWCLTTSSSWSHSRLYASTSLNSDTTKWGSSKWVDCDSKRQLMLSNWEIIWDLAWNVWEHVNWANNVNELWTSYTTMLWSICSWADGYYEFNACTFISPYLYANQWPKTLNLSSSNWIWKIYSYAAWWSTRVFIRGGHAQDTINAWLFTLILNATSWDNFRYLGFRCAK